MTARPVPIRDGPHLEQVLGQIHDRLGRIEERTSGIEERMVTKDDLEAFATKDDLEAFATKDDLDVVVKEIRVGFSDINTGMAAIHEKLDSR